MYIYIYVYQKQSKTIGKATPPCFPTPHLAHRPGLPPNHPKAFTLFRNMLMLNQKRSIVNKKYHLQLAKKTHTSMHQKQSTTKGEIPPTCFPHSSNPPPGPTPKPSKSNQKPNKKQHYEQRGCQIVDGEWFIYNLHPATPTKSSNMEQKQSKNQSESNPPLASPPPSNASPGPTPKPPKAVKNK